MRFRFLTLSLLAGAGLWAQDYIPSFPRREYFRNAFGTLDSRVELQNPVKLQDYAVGGKLEMSLRQYLEAVLANNTDVAIQRYTVDTNKNAITRAFGVFDPFVSLAIGANRSSTQSTDQLGGALVRNDLRQPLDFRYTQVLPTGTQYYVNYNAIRASNNSSFALYNPVYNSGFNINLAQPLLRGRGSFYTKLPITIARSRLKAADFGFQDQVLRLLTDAENAYWDVVSARESLRVQEKALDLANQLLKRARRELELGASSPLDIYQPEQQVATQEIAVTQARYRIQQVEDVLRRQAGIDLDPDLRKLPIVLTESPSLPGDNKMYDREAIVQQALGRRPDLQSARQSLDVDELQIKQFKNLLLPNLALTGQYGTTGVGGTFFQRQTAASLDGTLNNIIAVQPGGFGNAFTQMFGFGLPVYGFGLSLQLPIRDHVNMANLADAKLNKKLDMLRIRTTEQQIRQDVLNAVTLVESSREGVKLAQVALDYAQKRVDAEQKKYDLGTTTIFFLITAQQDLTRAESDLVNQVITYRRNLLNLSRRTGDLLQERNLVLQP